MRGVYRGIAWLIAALVAVQAATVAASTFGVFNWVDDDNSLTKSVLESDWEWTASWGALLHGMVGMMVIPLLALLLLIVSFFTKAPGAVLFGLLVLLDVVAQVVVAFVAFSVPVVGLVHGLNAFVLFGLAMAAATRVGRAPAAHAETEAGRPARV